VTWLYTLGRGLRIALALSVVLATGVLFYLLAVALAPLRLAVGLFREAWETAEVVGGWVAEWLLQDFDDEVLP